MLKTIRGLLTLVLVIAATEARAGPPYVSDDPEPTEPGHWEIYNFIQGSRALGVTSGQAGLDINYGAFENFQLTAVLPLDYTQGPELRLGAGDIELAGKYRFLHQEEGSLLPDVAVFPRLFVPSANRTFGSGRANLFLPLWAQKDFDSWSLFGGGGYTINPGPDARSFWLISWALQRTITEQLSVGIELYHQTPDAIDAKQYTASNIGVTYRLNEHWSLLASGGPGLQNAREGGRFNFYVSLKADY